jgi:hypothetical protein
MNVSAIGAQAAQYGSGPRPAPPSLDATAKLLGMSTDELDQARASGTTLADLAAGKGVSKDALVASIAADLKANLPQGAAAPSDARLTQLATGIAEGKHTHGHHHHRHHHAAGATEAAGATATQPTGAAATPGTGIDALV